MLAAVWLFLNSPLGTTISLSVIAWLFKKGVDSKDRRTYILGLAELAFHIAEQEGGPGVQKYKKFITTIVDSLKAADKPALSGPEMAMLQGLADVKAMLKKPKLPLPAPMP